MARRLATEEDNSSGNEEIPKVKDEKKKDKGKQRARIEEDADEEQLNDYENDADDADDDQISGSPKAAKRRRVNGEGDSYPSPTDSDLQRRIVKTLPRDTDGYIPGSIVRIQLKNFLTYDAVEFRPGPHLNMIIGPNGTGKSSVACAIAIGLNWSPAILGRATELPSFVKNDTDKGYTEIELKGLKGQPNLVIRRNLSAKSKGSTFTINGQAATGNEIKQKMMDLNVQVGNLCSFLPQDKVSEFAAMTPQELLRETQRAAGNENLTRWHTTLISTGKDHRAMLQTIKEEEELLKQMKERNESIRKEVERFLEREKIENAIALLEILIPVQLYRTTRELYVQKKAEQRMLHRKVTALKQKNEPAHALLKKLEADHKTCEKHRDEMKKDTQAKFKKMQNKWTASEKLEADAEDITTKLSELKKDEKERLRKIRTTESDIEKTETELARVVKMEDQQALSDEAKQIHLERSEVVARKDELDPKLKSNIDRKARATVSLEKAYEELKKLDDADVRKLQMLKRWDQDTHDAILWLRANKHRFKMEVFEPPFMVMTIKDRRFTNSIEACFSGSQIRTFIPQCQEDLNTLNQAINDSPGLGRKARVATWFRTQREDLLLPVPMTREELKQNNFDGYAMDYIDVPSGMEWFLKKEVNLHRTPLALNGKAVDVNKVMGLVARPSAIHPGGATFINGSTLNNVSRSRYGRKAIGNMTRDIQQARNFVIPTVDPEIKQRIDDAIREMKQEIALCDEERRGLDEELKKIEQEDAVFQKRITALKQRRKAIEMEQTRRITNESKLKRYKAELQKLRDAPPVDKKRTKLKQELLELTKKRVAIAKDYGKLARAIIAEQTQCTQTGLEWMQIGANRAALQELCNRKDEKYQTALAEFTKVDAEFRKIKADSVAVLQQSRDIVSEAREEIAEEYRKIEEVRVAYDNALKTSTADGTAPPDPTNVELRSLEELEMDLANQKSALDMTLQANAGVVEQYDKRQKDIAQLDITLADRRAKADKVERGIKIARENWKPALEKLVASIGEKFSSAFDRIGCAGEIRISEHEDYEKWAIDILVKFRDSEKLQLLTGQRQSGGERSLTTILYLMSLTEEARAPFSLVDEINQGMDQRAERMVHNSMVEVTCKPDSAQYFLITPKLLPDLKYHERMKILCVNNGEWLPEERGLGNMMNMIDVYVQRQSRAPNGA